ncbi:cation:proton antiporter [Thiotrichales bacterium 19S3-7]|nr:cation:proton antiporter [Thiotrichales bacterium 19S3-7]MCF6802043.1 cation:proton antiporter [Thiotrichales bacterium 19S3-11]
MATDSHHMMIDLIPYLCLFFGIAGVVVPLLQRIRISPIIGYLICGIIIGPFGLIQISQLQPWVSHITIRDTNTVELIGELGIITLMFMIGLELSLDRLKELRRYIFGLGTLQILITAGIIATIAKLFDNSLEISILIGATFALSSTAIVMKFLEERKLINRPIGMLCLSILLMQDLAVIPILVLISSFTVNTQTNLLMDLGVSLIVGICVVIVIYWLGKRILKPLFQSVSFSKSPEWLAALVVFIVISFSLLTYMAELSMALGSFIAGLLIAETEFKHEVEIIINPLKGFLLGIFFLSIGMMINLKEILNYPLLLLLAIVGIYTLKSVILFILCYIFKVPARESAETAVYLSQPGEFALMILGIAMTSQLMPQDNIQFFLIVTVVSMMISPILFKLAPLAGNYSHRLSKNHKAMITPSNTHEKQEVVIAGFGRVGQLIGMVLKEQTIPYIAFDHDGESVQKLRKQNFKVIYGDARKKELWQHLIGDTVKVVVIAIDDDYLTSRILRLIKTKYPLLPIIVRSKHMKNTTMLYEKGANFVVTETLESSLHITQLVIEQLNASPNQAREIIESIRNRFNISHKRKENRQ